MIHRAIAHAIACGMPAPKDEAAVALHFCYYNFIKLHKRLRCTPAMAAGVASSQWTVCELLERTT